MFLGITTFVIKNGKTLPDYPWALSKHGEENPLLIVIDCDAQGVWLQK